VGRMVRYLGDLSLLCDQVDANSQT